MSSSARYASKVLARCCLLVKDEDDSAIITSVILLRFDRIFYFEKGAIKLSVRSEKLLG